MSLLDKIIFIADYIEPGRKDIPGLSEARRLAFSDINQCLLKIIENTMQYLKSRDQAIDPRTTETHEYYKEGDHT